MEMLSVALQKNPKRCSQCLERTEREKLVLSICVKRSRETLTILVICLEILLLFYNQAMYLLTGLSLRLDTMETPLGKNGCHTNC